MSFRALSFFVVTAFAAAPLFAQQPQDEPATTRWTRLGAQETRSSDLAALARLNAVASKPFQAATSRDGKIVALHGGRIESAGASDPVARGTAFFARFGEVFSLDPALTLVASRTANFDDRVAFTFEYAGRPILGPRAFAGFDGSGAVTSAALWNAPAASLIASHAVGAAIAAERASIALSAERARLGFQRALRAPRTQEVLVAEGGALRAMYRVVIASQEPAEAWSVLIDGVSGESVEIEDLICRGTKGFMPIGFDGSFIQTKKFKIGSGAKGNVFKSQSGAIAGTASPNTNLENFGLQSVPQANSPKGFTFGARANVFDANTNDPFSASLSFNFDPILDADDFDVTNTYYQLEEFYQHVRKNLGVKDLASNLSMPVIVNFKTAELNAFFAPDFYPDAVNPLTFGFMVFNDNSNLSSDPFDDISRDPVVAGHEYTHAWLFYEGLDFTDPLDFPSRALNEAVADFFGSSKEQDFIIARYTGLEMLASNEGLRNLQDDDQFPQTTQDGMTMTMSGLPEEHRNGEIFAAALIDIRDALGVKAAEKLVFRSLPDMPRSVADSGLSNFAVTNDPLGATDIFMGDCLFGLLINTNTDDELAAAVGAFTARGLLGGPVSDNDVVLNLEALDGKVKELFYPSTLPRTGTTHRYLFRAKQNRKLDVYLYMDPADSLLANFSITASDGDPGAITFTNPVQQSVDGKIVWRTAMTLNLPLGKNPASTDPFYTISVSSTNNTTGEYVLQVRAK